MNIIIFTIYYYKKLFIPIHLTICAIITPSGYNNYYIYSKFILFVIGQN